MFEAVEKIADEYPNNIAFDFMGRSTTYREMVTNIEKCARSLRTIGVREGDKVTIAMPNCPQAIYMFYADEPRRCRREHGAPALQPKRSSSSTSTSPKALPLMTLDQFYHKIESHPPEHTAPSTSSSPASRTRCHRPMKAGLHAHRGQKDKEDTRRMRPIIMLGRVHASRQGTASGTTA